MTFVKKFDVRWADIDANRHLIHTAYSAYMVEARMAFLGQFSIDINAFEQAKIGPVILNEHIHYIKEINPGESIYVDVETGGFTDDGQFILFHQSLYNQNGQIAAYSEILISWISFENRKLTAIPETWVEMLNAIPKSESFTQLDKSTIRYDHVPYRKILNSSLL